MYLFAVVRTEEIFLIEAGVNHILYVTDENKFDEENCLYDGYPEYGDMIQVMTPLQEHGIYESQECVYELTCSKEEAERIMLEAGHFKMRDDFTAYIESLGTEE